MSGAPEFSTSSSIRPVLERVARKPRSVKSLRSWSALLPPEPSGTSRDFHCYFSNACLVRVGIFTVFSNA